MITLQDSNSQTVTVNAGETTGEVDLKVVFTPDDSDDFEVEDTHDLTIVNCVVDGLKVYDPKLTGAGSADIRFQVSGPNEGFSPRVVLSILDGDEVVSCLVRKTETDITVNEVITTSWNGKWGNDENGNDTPNKGLYVDPGKYTVRLSVYESSEHGSAFETVEYDIHVTRLGVVEVNFKNNQPTRYHKRSPGNNGDFDIDNPHWKIEHADFKVLDPLAKPRTQARVEQTSMGECYNDTDNIRGRTSDEWYFDATGSGAYNGTLRQVNFPPQIPGDDPDVITNWISAQRFNRPVVYVRNQPITVSVRLSSHAISDILSGENQITDVDAKIPLTEYQIRVIGEYRGEDLGPSDKLVANNTSSDMTSAENLPETVGHDVEEITFRFQYREKDEDDWENIPGNQTTTHLIYRLAASPTDFAKQQGEGRLYMKIVDFTCNWAMVNGKNNPEEVFGEIWNGSNFWTPFQGNPLEPDRQNGFRGQGDPVETALRDQWNKAPKSYTYKHNGIGGSSVSQLLDEKWARCRGWVNYLRTFSGTHGLASQDQLLPPMRWRFVDGVTGEVTYVNNNIAIIRKNMNQKPNGNNATKDDIWFVPYGMWVGAHGQANPYLEETPIIIPDPVGNNLLSFFETFPQFTDHVVVKIDNKFYDPSYQHPNGVSYDSINELANSSVSFYLYHQKYRANLAGEFVNNSNALPWQSYWTPKVTTLTGEILHIRGWKHIQALRVNQDPATNQFPF